MNQESSVTELLEGSAMNFLNAAFWDYPQYTDYEHLYESIRKSPDKRRWIMKRLLEHARVVDTWKFFSISEVAEDLSKLNLSPYAYKKWKRIIEVYGTEGK